MVTSLHGSDGSGGAGAPHTGPAAPSSGGGGGGAWLLFYRAWALRFGEATHPTGSGTPMLSSSSSTPLPLDGTTSSPRGLSCAGPGLRPDQVRALMESITGSTGLRIWAQAPKKGASLPRFLACITALCVDDYRVLHQAYSATHGAPHFRGASAYKDDFEISCDGVIRRLGDLLADYPFDDLGAVGFITTTVRVASNFGYCALSRYVNARRCTLYVVKLVLRLGLYLVRTINLHLHAAAPARTLQADGTQGLNLQVEFDIGVGPTEPTSIFTDAKAVTDGSHLEKPTRSSRRLATKYAIIRWGIALRAIRLARVEAGAQTADILTKPLVGDEFYVDNLQLYDWLSAD